MLTFLRLVPTWVPGLQDELAGDLSGLLGVISSGVLQHSGWEIALLDCVGMFMTYTEEIQGQI